MNYPIALAWGKIKLQNKTLANNNNNNNTKLRDNTLWAKAKV